MLWRSSSSEGRLSRKLLLGKFFSDCSYFYNNDFNNILNKTYAFLPLLWSHSWTIGFRSLLLQGAEQKSPPSFLCLAPSHHAKRLLFRASVLLVNWPSFTKMSYSRAYASTTLGPPSMKTVFCIHDLFCDLYPFRVCSYIPYLSALVTSLSLGPSEMCLYYNQYIR